MAEHTVVVPPEPDNYPSALDYRRADPAARRATRIAPGHLRSELVRGSSSGIATHAVISRLKKPFGIAGLSASRIVHKTWTVTIAYRHGEPVHGKLTPEGVWACGLRAYRIVTLDEPPGGWTPCTDCFTDEQRYGSHRTARHTVTQADREAAEIAAVHPPRLQVLLASYHAEIADINA